MARELTNVEQEALRIARQGIPISPENTIPLSPEKLAKYFSEVLKDKLELTGATNFEHKPKWVLLNALILRIIREAFISAERYDLTVQGYLNGKNPEIIPQELETLAQNPEFMKGLFQEVIKVVFTAHPNGFLGFELEDDAREFVNLVTDLIKRSPYLLTDIAKWDDKTNHKPAIFGTTLKDISANLSSMWNNLKVPEKMKPHDESRRLCGWIEMSYKAVPDYMEQVHQLRYNYSAPEIDKKNMVISNTHLSEPNKRMQTIDQYEMRQICTGDGLPRYSPSDEAIIIPQAAADLFTESVLRNRFGVENRVIAQYAIPSSSLSYKALSELRKTNFGTSGGYCTIEELNSIPLPEKEDWTAFDADGKDATQPWTIKYSLKERKHKLRTLYSDSINEIISDIISYDNKHPDADNACAELRKLSNDIHDGKSNWKQTLAQIVSIKTKYEDRGFIFPQAVDSHGKYIAFSKFDVLYKSVQSNKDYGAKGQIRQNARQNKEGLEAINVMLRNIAKTGDLPNFDCNIDISETPEVFNEYLTKHPQEAAILRNKLEGVLRILYNPIKRASQEDRDITQEELQNLRNSAEVNGLIDGLESAGLKRFVQMMGFLQIAKRNPEGIGSIVIAEGATATDEAKKSGDDKVIRDSVVKNGLRDMRQLLTYKLLNGAENEVKIEPIQLSEDPPTIDNKSALIEKFYNSPDILNAMTEDAKPVMKFDAELNQWRQMNVAEFKLARGMSGDITKADYKTPVFYASRLMDAGSDSTLRGSKASAPMISISRTRTERFCANNPRNAKIDGKEVFGVFIPQIYAGIGEGSARQSGVGNHVSELIHCWTNQGGGNIMKDINHDIILLQIAHARAKQRDFELKTEIGKKDNFEHLRESRIKESATPYRLTAEEEEERLNERSRAAVKARMDMVASKQYDDHLTYGTNAARAKESNKSARKQNRSGSDGDASKYPLPVKFGGFRAIGHYEVDNGCGLLATQTYIAKFFKPHGKSSKNGLLLTADRKELMHFFIKDIITNNVLWDSLESFSLADMKTAWKAEGCNLETTPDNKTIVIRELNGKTYKSSVDELAKAYKSGELPDGFRASHAATAMHHQDFISAGKAIYEIFYRVKFGKFPDGNLSKDKKATLLANLKDDKFTLDNISKMMLELMPDGMRREVKSVAKSTDYMRGMVTSEHLNNISNSGKETGLTAKQVDHIMTIIKNFTNEDFHFAALIHYVKEEFGGRGHQKCIKSQEIQVPANAISKSTIALR